MLNFEKYKQLAQRFPYMESELFSLASAYDTPRLSFYGFLDAFRMLFVCPIEFAIIHKRQESNPIFYSVSDPSLEKLFRSKVDADFIKVKPYVSGEPISLFSGVVELFREEIFLLLYKPIFSVNIGYETLGSRSREVLILRYFIRWLYGDKESKGPRPSVSLIESYAKKITPTILKNYGARIEKDCKNIYAIDTKMIDSYLENVSTALNLIYSHTAIHCPLLRSMPGQNPGTPVNLFFFLITPLKPEERRHFRGYEYNYSCQLMIPETQHVELKNSLTKAISNILQQGRRGGKYKYEDIHRVAGLILEDCKIPLLNERSILDRPLTSGILCFSDPLDDTPEYTQDEAVPKGKILRNKASRRLFRMFFGNPNEKYRLHGKLEMQQYVNHVAGTPYLLTCTISNSLSNSLNNNSHEENFKSWLYHYGFYATVMNRINIKFKKDMKARYFSMFGDILLRGFSQISQFFYGARKNNDADYQYYVKILEEIIKKMNEKFLNLSFVMPFNKIEMSMISSSCFEFGQDLGDDVLRGRIICECWGYKFVFDNIINDNFHHHLPIQYFSYNNEIRYIIDRVVRSLSNSNETSVKSIYDRMDK